MAVHLNESRGRWNWVRLCYLSTVVNLSLSILLCTKYKRLC